MKRRRLSHRQRRAIAEARRLDPRARRSVSPDETPDERRDREQLEHLRQTA